MKIFVLANIESNNLQVADQPLVQMVSIDQCNMDISHKDIMAMVDT